jgi:predicted nucleic acid-binding protein
MSFLLDTNVVSEARKPRPHPRVAAWFNSVSGSELYISVLVVGEIRQGIDRLRHRDPGQAGVYEAWLGLLRRDYGDRVIPITARVAEEWGRLSAPDPLPAIDGLMAATARVHDLTFVTRNVADVTDTGVRVLNPFDD